MNILTDLLLEARRQDLKYVEKKVKDNLDKVIVELKGSESGSLTRLADRYKRLDDAIDKLSKQRSELNLKVKEMSEDYFDPEDVVLTRIIETVSFTMQLSKRVQQPDAVSIDYEGIAKELAKLIPDELQKQVDEITAAYTKITPKGVKSPALSIKSKVKESIGSDLLSLIKNTFTNLVKSIKDWSTSYDKKLETLKNKLK